MREPAWKHAREEGAGSGEWNGRSQGSQRRGSAEIVEAEVGDGGGRDGGEVERPGSGVGEGRTESAMVMSAGRDS